MGAANTALNPLAGVGDDLTKSAASALGGGEGNNVLEKFANDVKEKIGLGNDKKLEARLVALEQRVTTLEGRGRR
jgi:hypothetical protein